MRNLLTLPKLINAFVQLLFSHRLFNIWQFTKPLKTCIHNSQLHKYNFLFLLIFCSVSCFSQVANDVISIGGSNTDDRLKNVTVDDQNNIYILMQSYGAMEMNGSSISTTIMGVPRTTLTKLDSNKNLIWHKEFNYFTQAVSPTMAEPTNMFIDTSGNVYVTDRYTNNFNVPPFSFSNAGDFYVTYKLDINGNLIWATNCGGLKINESGSGTLELLQYHSYSDSIGNELITNSQGSIAWLDTAGNYVNHLQYDHPSYSAEVVMGKNTDGNFYGYRKFGATSSFEYISFNAQGVTIDSNITHYNSNFPQSIIHDPISNTYYNIVLADDRVPLNSTTPFYDKKLMLLRLDEQFNLIGKINLSGTLDIPGGSVDLFRLAFIDGALFLTGIINISFGSITWTSLGQSVYLYPEDEKMIISKFTKDLSYQWHRQIPGNYYVSNVCSPRAHNNNILFSGTQEAFQMDTVNFTTYPSSESDAYLLTLIDTTNNYLQLEGTVFKDLDQNGVFTNLEPGIPYRQIANNLLPDNMYFTDFNGNYSISVPNTNQLITSNDMPPFWNRSTDDSVYVYPNPMDTIITDIDFGMYPIPGLMDMTVDLTAITNCVIGNDATYNITVCNNGNDTSSGVFYIVQNEYLNFLSSSIAPDSIQSDTLFYSYSGLGALECINLTVTDSVSNLVSILGQNILIGLTVLPSSQDANDTNNSDFILHHVTGSYDPNDITVWPSCGITQNFINNGLSLDYRIRFQNTGNDTASFITIKDTLSPHFDYSTFKYISSSHPVIISINNGVLILQYDNIDLPDSTANPEGSKGFFKYSIQPNSSVPVGSSILNSADIFFDYNPPIMTNTEISNIEDPSNLFGIMSTPASCPDNGSIFFDGFCVTGGLWYSLNGANYVFDQDGIIDNISPGTYALTLSNGQDTITANSIIIAYAPITSYSTVNICSNDSIYFGGVFQTNTGIYIDTLSTVYGCDSIATLNLVVNTSPNLTTSISGTTITAENVTASYVWLNCNNNFSVIANENSQSFTPLANGSYSVELTNNWCVDTSVCVNITTVGIIENDFGSEFAVYPNPTNGQFSIDIGRVYAIVTVNLTDLNGKIIQSQTFNNTKLLDLSVDEPAGVYLLSVQAEESKGIIRLIKK